MRDLECPLLTPGIVSDLTGLSPRWLRQWDALGIPASARRRRAGKPTGGRRLYSWDDVEHLQQATHLIKTRRLHLAEVRRLLEQGVTASLSRGRVIASPASRHRRRQSPAGAASPRRASSSRRMPRGNS
jgi:DNA-binding transcriptional MerR regulator